MRVEELIQALLGFPPEQRVVVQCNVGYSDIAVTETSIAANYHNFADVRSGPLSHGVHAKPDRIFEQIEATEIAVLIRRDP